MKRSEAISGFLFALGCVVFGLSFVVGGIRADRMVAAKWANAPVRLATVLRPSTTSSSSPEHAVWSTHLTVRFEDETDGTADVHVRGLLPPRGGFGVGKEVKVRTIHVEADPPWTIRDPGDETWLDAEGPEGEWSAFLIGGLLLLFGTYCGYAILKTSQAPSR